LVNTCYLEDEDQKVDISNKGLFGPGHAALALDSFKVYLSLYCDGHVHGQGPCNRERWRPGLGSVFNLQVNLCVRALQLSACEPFST
jgi:hypothetical protein